MTYLAVELVEYTIHGLLVYTAFTFFNHLWS
jgi:hypothetical protein